MIELEIETEILRPFHQEKRKIGTIVRELKIHNGVVKRVLARKVCESEIVAQKKKILTTFTPFFQKILGKDHGLSSRRHYEMILQRGYPSGAD